MVPKSCKHLNILIRISFCLLICSNTLVVGQYNSVPFWQGDGHQFQQEEYNSLNPSDGVFDSQQQAMEQNDIIGDDQPPLPVNYHMFQPQTQAWMIKNRKNGLQKRTRNQVKKNKKKHLYREADDFSVHNKFVPPSVDKRQELFQPSLIQQQMLPINNMNQQDHPIAMEPPQYRQYYQPQVAPYSQFHYRPQYQSKAQMIPYQNFAKLQEIRFQYQDDPRQWQEKQLQQQYQPFSPMTNYHDYLVDNREQLISEAKGVGEQNLKEQGDHNNEQLGKTSQRKRLRHNKKSQIKNQSTSTVFDGSLSSANKDQQDNKQKQSINKINDNIEQTQEVLSQSSGDEQTSDNLKIQGTQIKTQSDSVNQQKQSLINKFENEDAIPNEYEETQNKDVSNYNVELGKRKDSINIEDTQQQNRTPHQNLEFRAQKSIRRRDPVFNDNVKVGLLKELQRKIETEILLLNLLDDEDVEQIANKEVARQQDKDSKYDSRQNVNKNSKSRSTLSSTQEDDSQTASKRDKSNQEEFQTKEKLKQKLRFNIHRDDHRKQKSFHKNQQQLVEGLGKMSQLDNLDNAVVSSLDNYMDKFNFED